MTKKEQKYIFIQCEINQFSFKFNVITNLSFFIEERALIYLSILFCMCCTLYDAMQCNVPCLSLVQIDVDYLLLLL